MILGGYSSCWYIFHLCFLRMEHLDLGYNSTYQLLFTGQGVEHFQKMAYFQGGFTFQVQSGSGCSLQEDQLFNWIAGSFEDLQIFFLEPLDKVFANMLLIAYHNRSLYLFFLYQKIFPVVLQELQHGFVKDMIVQYLFIFVCSYHVRYGFQGESTLYSSLNAKELLAQNRRDI